jgi:hypothetical protein
MANIRTILFCALAAGLCAFGPAQAASCQLKMVGSMDIYTGSNGRLLVPVTVEGQSGYFRLDIGSPISAIVASASDNAGLKRSTLSYGTTLHVDEHQVIEQVAPELGLGGVKGDVYLAVAPQLENPDVREIGVLGFDVLRRFDVELDLLHNKLNLFSPDHCPNQVVYWTQSAPVAALPIQTKGFADFSVTMQLDGKDVQTAISSATHHARLSTYVAGKLFGIAEPADAGSDTSKPYAFKTLSVDGLTFMNPVIYPYIDPTNGRCGGGSYEDKTPMHSEAHGMIMRCFGEDDLYIGLPELRKLRVFFDFSEKMLYATVADAK